jgi:medium-chain acyl-[acyl-carrier-protein] hydrolase
MPLRTDNYTIQPPDATAQGYLKTGVLFDFMQISASKNAEDLGVGVAKMREMNLAWVLNRLTLSVERYPKVGETVALSTYPVRIDKYFVYRDFQLHDADGQRIAKAVSVWLLLDLEKRSMSSVPAFVHQIEYPEIQNPLPPMSGKILPLKTVDFNDHASNVSYVNWLVEAMPLAIQNACFLKNLDITYRAECYLNDVILIETCQKMDENAVSRFSGCCCTSYTEGSLFQQKIVRESDVKDLVWANVLYHEHVSRNVIP